MHWIGRDPVCGKEARRVREEVSDWEASIASTSSCVEEQQMSNQPDWVRRLATSVVYAAIAAVAVYSLLRLGGSADAGFMSGVSALSALLTCLLCPRSERFPFPSHLYWFDWLAIALVPAVFLFVVETGMSSVATMGIYLASCLWLLFGTALFRRVLAGSPLTRT